MAKKGSVSEAAATLGRVGRAQNTPAQAKASRKNGKKNTGSGKDKK